MNMGVVVSEKDGTPYLQILARPLEDDELEVNAPLVGVIELRFMPDLLDLRDGKLSIGLWPYESDDQCIAMIGAFADAIAHALEHANEPLYRGPMMRDPHGETP